MPTFIIVIIVGSILALVGYAFISQSIEKKRIQKQRILMTLKTKQRNLLHLINGFPPNFLSNDLLGLVYKALINTCDQLSKIETANKQHQDDITLYTNQFDALSKTNAQRARIENPQVMKDIRQHLQELQNFLTLQQASGAINKVQFVAFSDQVKRLNVQMTVDGYLYQAKQAQQIGKLRLAIHYFTLAKKLLSAENATHIYDKQIAQLDGIMSKLEEKAQIAGEPDDVKKITADTSGEHAAIADTDVWKKKQLYD